MSEFQKPYEPEPDQDARAEHLGDAPTRRDVIIAWVFLAICFAIVFAAAQGF